jgi:hypothetical protein
MQAPSRVAEKSKLDALLFTCPLKSYERRNLYRRAMTATDYQLNMVE